MTFDAFVRDRAPHLLRIAYMLTRDHGHAEDLLQTALVRSYLAWRRIDGDPEPYVRKVLVNSFASWRGRRWHGECPTETLPEIAVTPHAAVDDRDEIWRALMRLPRQQRAVVVLRYFEDMSEAQIADALGISTGAVKAYAARGLATLRADETLRRIEIPDAPAVVERGPAVRARVRHQRGRRALSIAAGLVTAACLVLVYALVPHRGAGPEPLSPVVGDVYRGYRIAAVMSGRLDDGPVSGGYVPAAGVTGFFALCVTGPGNVTDPPKVTVSLSGTVVGAITCGTSLTPTMTQFWTTVPGVPLTVTLGPPRATHLPPGAFVYIAFGDPDTADQYVYPRAADPGI